MAEALDGPAVQAEHDCAVQPCDICVDCELNKRFTAEQSDAYAVHEDNRTYVLSGPRVNGGQYIH